jgi:carbon monoxide dehydrogenase subunit G
VHLEHSFSVSAGVQETWRAMLDPERMAKCIPGAALDSVKNGVASGAIRVRFGPIGPTYRGTAQVVDKDDEGHRAIVEAQGGTRAHGEATVRLIVTLSAFGDSTNVMLQSDVRLTGRAAEELDGQIVSEAGDRLCRQVAARLNDLLAPPPREAASPAVNEAPADETTADEVPADEAPVDESPVDTPAEAPSATPSEASSDTPSERSAEQPAAPLAGASRARTYAPVLVVAVILLLLRRRRRQRRRRLH